MRIDVFKTFDGVSYYGDIPQSFGLDDAIVESKRYSFDVPWSMLSDFALLIDDACDVALDAFDVEYIRYEKCNKLIDLLNTISYPEYKEMDKFIADLKVAAKRAIEYGTGVVVEL
ncbi:hypothetical protein [Atopobium deltae]|uniref:Uncharacterized protein n=1 Tax=Atopobium deltae TaxID=1393034 RepID=A0A133XQ54_9ACTN|nr:hypothetical protein [Atopobium deltae]KXB33067.1 hypothetical protein HMPREF3192_01443 [Atopobium deltae]